MVDWIVVMNYFFIWGLRMVKIKICGIRRLEDIVMVNKYKPDYIGFIFAESPRKVSYNQAKELSSHLDECIIPVGVFVNEHMKFIVDLFEDGIIKIAQLHGKEDEKYISNLKSMSKERTGSEIPIINAVEFNECLNDVLDKNDKIFVENKLKELSDSNADYLLLDSGKGSGKTFDWSLIENIDEILSKPYFLAGGLNSSNIELAIDEFNPFAVDLSSGVEINKFKDEKLVGEVCGIIDKINHQWFGCYIIGLIIHQW